jgi:type II secretory pathway pseudopilin PulG
MNMKPSKPMCERPPSRNWAAFTLVEVMLGVGVMGIMSVALYAGFTFAFAEIRLAQENVRATQILEERMEVVRLLNWDQVANLPGYIPSTFTAPFYADNPTNPPSDSFNYTGTVLVTNAPVTETYSSDLRMIQIQVRWPSGKFIRQRQMTTFISQYGVQKFVY